ncbi:MAG: hypothetical protein J5822_05725 [Eubacteriaceae bacterium]|nr:hypothetical protein [Eubacteriaceae bacterium]MBR5420009.1 hypothetical protein [Lachnospiraceae bacterium]
MGIFGRNRNDDKPNITGDFYTSYDMWGMGFSRKMMDSDLSGAVIYRTGVWEETLWDRKAVDEFARTPAAAAHFVAFRASRLRTEAINALSSENSSSLPWPRNLIYLISGEDTEHLPPDTDDTVEMILGSLNGKDREILASRLRDGRSAAETADLLDSGASSVSRMMKRILRELRYGFSFQMARIGREEYIKRIKGDPGALIFELPLKSGYKDILLRNNIFSVSDIQCLSRNDIAKMPHGGSRLADELRDAMEAFGCEAPFIDPGGKPSRTRKYTLEKELGIVSESYPGRALRLDLVSWDGMRPTYDVRVWTDGRKLWGSGISLSREEADALRKLLDAALEDGEQQEE